eukprot:6388582-Pyramimonas_sp.AAC.1
MPSNTSLRVLLRDTQSAGIRHVSTQGSSRRSSAAAHRAHRRRRRKLSGPAADLPLAMAYEQG